MRTFLEQILKRVQNDKTTPFSIKNVQALFYNGKSEYLETFDFLEIFSWIF